METTTEAKILKELALIRKMFAHMAKEHKAQEVEYLTEAQAMARLQKSKKSLLLLRKAGRLSFTSINGRSIQYLKSGVDSLLSEGASRF